MAKQALTTVNKGGRPYKWTSAPELEKRINEYFDDCDNHIEVVENLLYDEQLEEYQKAMVEWEDDGIAGIIYTNRRDWMAKKPVPPKKFTKEQKRKEYTISGLALWLNCDIETIKEYSKKDKFSVPIKRAYLRVQQWYENRLHWANPTGAIFALKNFNWKDNEVQPGWLVIKDSNVIVQLPKMPERLESQESQE